MVTSLERVLAASAVLMSLACGQDVGELVEPPADIPPRPLVAGTWTYGRVDRRGQVRDSQTYRLSREAEGGWLAVSGWHDTRRTSVDSLRLDAAGMQPIARVWRRTIDGREIRHLIITYEGERLEVIQDYPGHPEHRQRWSTTIPAETRPIISPAYGPAFGFAHTSQLLPLREGWAGAVYVAPMPHSGYYTELLRVTDDQTIRVPAGTFDCWRVVVGSRGQEWVTLWVAKDSGHLVKAVQTVEGREGVYSHETVLLSFKPA